MTTMEQYESMTIDERLRIKFKPVGDTIYEGRGYIVNGIAWGNFDLSELLEFKEWSIEHNCTWDGPVCVFPDLETLVMARLAWE